MNCQQYPIVAQRRQAYDTLLWQVPVVAVAAHGFFVTAALGAKENYVSACLFFAAAIIGRAIIYQFQKLRAREVRDAELLKKFEAEHENGSYEVVHGYRTPGISTYWIWLGILYFIVIGELVGAVWKIH